MSPTNHGPALSTLLKKAMLNRGITKTVLENASLKHKFSPGYRKSKQIFGATGLLYCPELWQALGSPAFKDGPIFQYDIGQLIGLRPYVFDLGDELDEKAVADHFEILVGQGIDPIVRSVQTPIQAAKYAMDHPQVILASQVVTDRYLRRWGNYYGLDYNSPTFADDDV